MLFMFVDTSKSKLNFSSSPSTSTSVKAQSSLIPSNTTSNDQKSGLEKTNCPICSKTFLQDEIEVSFYKEQIVEKIFSFF